jgi:hypothetical protein
MTVAWKPALLLMLLSPLLAEVISGGTPITRFAMPGVLLPYVTLVYGIPVLVLREVAARRGYGPLGLWCLGALYGLYNEGLLAETIFHPFATPVAPFDTYGLLAHVRLPFVVWIAAWHGVFSVLTPVVIVEHRLPRRDPWLPAWATWTLAALCLTAAGAHFLLLGDSHRALRPAALAFRLLLLLAAGAALWLPAARLPRSASLPARPFTAGAALFLLMSTVPEVLAENRLPWPFFLAYFAVLAAAVAWIATRGRGAHEATRPDAAPEATPAGADAVMRARLMRLVLGGATAQAVLAVVFGAIIGDYLWALAGALFTAALVPAARRVSLRP